jgi:hypothetical protein
MKNQHLTDAEVQQYALKNSSCAFEISEHVQHCPNCKIRAELYSQLFDAISEQEKPIFEFNLADLVLEKLPKHEKKVINKNSLLFIMVFITVLLIYTFSYFFGKQVAGVFAGMTPIIIGLLITTVTSILIFLCTDNYKKHLTKMQALNFY